MLNRASLVIVALAALLAGCNSPSHSNEGVTQGVEPGVAVAATPESSNPLVGTWRCSADGSKLIQNADGTGSWSLDGGSSVGYHFKWTTEGQSLVLTTDRTPAPQQMQYGFDPSGNLLITGPNGQIISYAREGKAPAGVTSATAEPPQRTANRGDGPRLWADEQIEQNYQELIRSAPQPTDTPDDVRKKVEKLQAAAADIRSTASSGFPDRRAQYEKYATELEAKAQEWSSRLQAGGTPAVAPAQPAGSAGGNDPLSSGFGAPPR